MEVEVARRTLIELLTKADERDALRSGALRARLGESGAPLDTIDFEQLDRAATLLRRDVVTRRRRGAAPLVEQFRKTLGGRSTDAIAEGFVRSPEFEAYRELPHGTPGLCAEEAFFRFLRRADIGDAETRTHEYLRAAALALTVHARPSFSLPEPFEPVAGAFVALVDGPHLYAAVRGRFIQGAVPEVVAEVLRRKGARPANVDPTLWRAAVERLVGLGFDLVAERNAASAHYI